MGRSQNFFEYQKMLSDEYAALDPKRLLRLSSIFAEREMDRVGDVLVLEKYAAYRDVFHLACKIVKDDDGSMRGTTVDQCQRDLSAVCHKLSRKSKFEDDNKKRLSRCADRLLQFIHYLKTEDPLYLLSTLEEMKTLDVTVVAEYEDQLVLLGRLKSFLKV